MVETPISIHETFVKVFLKEATWAPFFIIIYFFIAICQLISSEAPTQKDSLRGSFWAPYGSLKSFQCWRLASFRSEKLHGR